MLMGDQNHLWIKGWKKGLLSSFNFVSSFKPMGETINHYHLKMLNHGNFKNLLIPDWWATYWANGDVGKANLGINSSLLKMSYLHTTYGTFSTLLPMQRHMDGWDWAEKICFSQYPYSSS